MSRKITREFAKVERPKSKLGLPDLDHCKGAVLNSLRSPESRETYQQRRSLYRSPDAQRCTQVVMLWSRSQTEVPLSARASCLRCRMRRESSNV